MFTPLQIQEDVMAIHTGRASDSGQVTIDRTRCTLCGTCAEICPSETLSLAHDEIRVDPEGIFGCIACGQCMAVCPEECIEVTGRDLSPVDMVPQPPESERANYRQLHALLLSRRSARRFSSRDIDRSVIDQIVASVTTAPMGIPPSDVEIMVIDRRDKVKEFGDDVVNGIARSLFVLKLFASPLARPFLGRQTYLSMKTFILPLTKFLVESRAKGNDYLLYGAPMAMYFHASSFSDPADAMIAATYATIAAESLGLGSCMIGTIAPFISRSKETMKKWGIPAKNRQGIMVIFGYPTTKYRRAVKRRLARVYTPEV
jgi:ferredoxin/nitroreductase